MTSIPAEKPRVLLFIPVYNCAKQLRRVLEAVSGCADRFEEVLIVDNGSSDATPEVAREVGATLGTRVSLVRNRLNLNLGGSHKVAFGYAIRGGFDLLVVLHGDDQGDVRDVLPVLDGISPGAEWDCWLGSRFMWGARRQGYSFIRTVGNWVFNALFSLVTLRWINDLGSGLNVFSVRALAGNNWYGFRNNLTFNYYVTLGFARWKWRCRYFPISWRETDQVSSVRVLRQIREMLVLLARYVWDADALLRQDFNGLSRESYDANVVWSNGSAAPRGSRVEGDGEER